MFKREKLKIHILIMASIWLIFSVIGYGIGQLTFGTSEFQDFADNGISIYGNVIEKHQEDNGRIDYSYIVNGTEYFGKGQGGRGNPQFKELEIGQKVVVFYKPENPEKSMMGYPQLDIGSNNQMIWAITLITPFFPMVIIIVFYIILINKNKKSANL